LQNLPKLSFWRMSLLLWISMTVAWVDIILIEQHDSPT
jgi:hypothetical protein